MLRRGALGDFILTLPAITALRRRWPGVYIELAGRCEMAEPAVAAGLVDAVTSVDSARLAPFFLPSPALPSAERKWIRSFDIVVCFLHDPEGAVRANFVRNGARLVLGIPARVHVGHAIDHYLRPLRELGVRAAGNESARLDLPPRCRAEGRRILEMMGLSGEVVAVHPGSGSPKKNWPLNNFLVLAAELERANCGSAVFVAGEADEAIAAELRKNGMPFPLSENRPVMETASMLSACKCYVGNDSGVTHLAAALGVPTVALFGTTDPARWAPRGPHVTVIDAARRPGGEKRMCSIEPCAALDAVRRACAL